MAKLSNIRSSIRTLIPTLLAISAAVVLLTHLPALATIEEYFGLLLVFALLTAFILQFGVLLSETDLSPAHIIGMVAVLSLPRDAQPAMIWAIFLGSAIAPLIAALVRMSRVQMRTRFTHRVDAPNETQPTPRRIVMVVARTTLSVFVAAEAYAITGGRLPLERLTLNDVWPLLAFSVTYVLVYLAIFLLETYSAGYSARIQNRPSPRILWRADVVELLVILMLPIPFALVAAETLNALSVVSFVIILAGLTVSLVSLHGISRAQRQLRQQVFEMRMLDRENAQLYNQQRARVTQLATLNNVLSLLTGTLSPDLVLDTVISSASAISDASAVAVYLFRQGEPESLTLARAAGLSPGFVANPPGLLLTAIAQANANSGDDGAQNVLVQHGPVVVNDVSGDEQVVRLMPQLRHIMAREGALAWIELPLAIGAGDGALVVYFDKPQFFSDEAVEILRTFASQAAQAISNARQYTRADKMLERLVEQLFGLAAIGRQLTATMSLETICNLVLSYASDATRASTGAIIFRDEESEFGGVNGSSGSQMRVVSQRGYPPGTFFNVALVSQGITGRVLRTGQTARVGSVRSDDDYLPLMPTMRSQLTVPIMRSGEALPLGAITLESEIPDVFTDEDVHFVSQLATQAVIAIDNAHSLRRATEARNRLQVILDAMAEGILLVDVNGIVLLANPRMELLDLKPDQLLGQPIEALLERADLDFARRIGFASDQEVRQLLKELRAVASVSRDWAEHEPETYTLQHEQGRLHIQRQLIPVQDEDDAALGVLLVFYNQTEERELERTREDISRMIVHDLRSPLTAVTTSLKLLRDLVPADSDVRPMVDTTTDAGQRAIRKLLGRVNSLLDVSKMENGQMTLDTEPTELATLADNVCVELSPLAQELDIAITSQVPEMLPLLDIDADKIERLLLNLVDNSLKFAPMESEILIRTYPPGKAGAPEDFVRIEVVDKGPGVPPEYKASLFDRYVQVQGRQGKRRGTGLGLTFCRLVTEAHGGRIWIEDNPQGGSIFAFTLPILKLNDEHE
ncbi:MAG: GAF domain-containing protein [Burkholderiales bacterium]|nr:GAF domain-containing protein [Anaerolineae bacterium]